MKKLILSVSAISLGFTVGCATGGNRVEEPPDANPGAVTELQIAGEPNLDEDSKSVTDTNISSSSRLDAKYTPLAQAVRSGRAQGIADETAKLLSMNSSDPVALNTLALYQLRRGRTGAAKLLLNRAFEKNPPSAALHNNLGVALLDEGNQAGAIVNFKKALQLDPRHAEASANLGMLYVQGGDYGKGLVLLQQAYKPLRGNIMVANGYAIALRAKNDYNGARLVYEEILKQNSRDVFSTLNLAILLIDFMNKPKEGLDLVYKVKFLETNRKEVLDRANALEKKAKGGLNL